MSERLALIIPALDEETTIGATLDALASRGIAQVIVVDNGSSDATDAVAHEHGAQVVAEPRRGYGRACLAGMAALEPGVSIVAFMDADGSDDPAELGRLVAPIERGEADLVIGSRLLGTRESGALKPQQQFGNRLATFLLRALFGARQTDLGPFRAIRRGALERLGMRDTDFGWTVEMQVKAALESLRVLEVPVSYRRRRGGKSKVAGTLRGSFLAGTKILWTIFRYRFRRARRT